MSPTQELIVCILRRQQPYIQSARKNKTRKKKSVVEEDARKIPQKKEKKIPQKNKNKSP